MVIGVPQTIFFANKSSWSSPVQLRFSFITKEDKERFYDMSGSMINQTPKTKDVLRIGLVINQHNSLFEYSGVVDRILSFYCKGLYFDDIDVFLIDQNYEKNWSISKYKLSPNMLYYTKYQMQRSFVQRLLNTYADPEKIKLHPTECIIGYVQSFIELEEGFEISDVDKESIIKRSGFFGN
ncbi:hypothetical protein [Acinetobacter puyangensis]|uniref:hypothetical protein n=1 Tax=Acinetobacter puyangensis TaxID=1096779 RepID=UPI003A4DAE2B